MEKDNGSSSTNSASDERRKKKQLRYQQHRAMKQQHSSTPTTPTRTSSNQNDAAPTTPPPSHVKHQPKSPPTPEDVPTPSHRSTLRLHERMSAIRSKRRVPTSANMIAATSQSNVSITTTTTTAAAAAVDVVAETAAQSSSNTPTTPRSDGRRRKILADAKKLRAAALAEPKRKPGEQEQVEKLLDYKAPKENKRDNEAGPAVAATTSIQYEANTHESDRGEQQKVSEVLSTEEELSKQTQLPSHDDDDIEEYQIVETPKQEEETQQMVEPVATKESSTSCKTNGNEEQSEVVESPSNTPMTPRSDGRRRKLLAEAKKLRAAALTDQQKNPGEEQVEKLLEYKAPKEIQDNNEAGPAVAATTSIQYEANTHESDSGEQQKVSEVLNTEEEPSEQTQLPNHDEDNEEYKTNGNKKQSEVVDEKEKEPETNHAVDHKPSHWDIRSILEHPPDQTLVENNDGDSSFIEDNQDLNDTFGSFDTAHIIVDDDHASEKDMDVVDNNGWDASSAVVFDNAVVHEVKEETNLEGGAIQTTQDDEWKLFDASVFETNENDTAKDGHEQQHDHDVYVSETTTETEKPYPDDEPLLLQEDTRSEVDSLLCETGGLTQHERIQAYTAVSFENDSSDDEEEESDDESEAPEVEYVTANNDEEDLPELVNTSSLDDATMEVSATVKPVVFNAAAVAAETAHATNTEITGTPKPPVGLNVDSVPGAPNDDSNVTDTKITCSPERPDDKQWIEVETSPSNNEASTTDDTAIELENNIHLIHAAAAHTKGGSTAASARSPPPPPPPPPPAGKKKQSNGVVPLLAPPPEAKFKKWQESKSAFSVPTKKMDVGDAREESDVDTDEGGQLPDAVFSNALLAHVDNTFTMVKWEKTEPHKGDALVDVTTPLHISVDESPTRALSPKTNQPESVPREADDEPVSPVRVRASDLAIDVEVPVARDGGARPNIQATPRTVRSTNETKKDKDPDGISPTLSVHGAAPSPKIMEKIALASSVASDTFEEHFSLGQASMSQDVLPVTETLRNATGSGESPPPDSASTFFCSPDNLLKENILVTASSMGISEMSSSDPKDMGKLGESEFPILTSAFSAVSSKEPTSKAGVPNPLEEDEAHNTGVQLVGGAFSTWTNSDLVYGPDINAVDHAPYENASSTASITLTKTNPQEIITTQKSEEDRLLRWLEGDVLSISQANHVGQEGGSAMRNLLEDDDHFNTLCRYVAGQVNKHTSSGDHLSTDKDPRPPEVANPAKPQPPPDKYLTMSEVMSSANRSLFDELDSVPSVPMSSTGLSTLSTSSFTREKAKKFLLKNKSTLEPFQLPADPESATSPKPGVLAANFVSYLQRVSTLTGVPSPFGEENPFVLEVVSKSMLQTNEAGGEALMDLPGQRSTQQIVFDHPFGGPLSLVTFMLEACRARSSSPLNHGLISTSTSLLTTPSDDFIAGNDPPTIEKGLDLPATQKRRLRGRNFIFPQDGDNPFETSVSDCPGLVLIVLGFLGDPQAVCRMKIVNRCCNRIISDNEHVAFRDAVRVGGLSMHLRPAFWLWVTLEKYEMHHEQNAIVPLEDGRDDSDSHATDDFSEMERIGREGKWHHVIERDVSRSFGNMPPHKTGAKLRTDSIVRALVTWGRNRIMKRGVKGGGDMENTPKVSNTNGKKLRHRSSSGPPPWENDDDASQTSEVSQTPTDTVSDWGGISPVGSCISACTPTVSESEKAGSNKAGQSSDLSTTELTAEELALSGNALTAGMKVELQNKLAFILHALAAAHPNVGYCQGMNYVVAHLLRVLQDTVLLHAMRGTLPSVIRSSHAIGSSLVVEETVFRVMDRFMMTYNLRHMYWPELRCLKTCCRVFEKLIQQKLPVLADHFEHHELNIGLFALGWFQTLFLYLPSMPSATVCHMWDIWLVERSFKIFFRVGTAILFLSQPILLNHELEGMMTYLNTFPDATLLNPDILIACALQIKVTNKMLHDFEMEVAGGQ